MQRSMEQEAERVCIKCGLLSCVRQLNVLFSKQTTTSGLWCACQRLRVERHKTGRACNEECNQGFGGQGTGRTKEYEREGSGPCCTDSEGVAYAALIMQGT